MNDLLEQFLVECRELVEAATGDLLALETSPRDQERLDAAFRGFHTLKGAAGIVGFRAMGQVLHAAESLLDSVRAGNRPVSGALIGDCLACLDQVVRWLEETEANGDIPALPDTAGDALAARLTPAEPAQLVPTPPEPTLPELSQPAVAEPAPAGAMTPDAPDWLVRLLERHTAHRAAAQTALRYAPDADCFFRGEDPLVLVAALPGILALDLTPVQPWPALEEFSPFECNLVITALASASPDMVATVLRPVSGQVEICPLVASRVTVKEALSPQLSPFCRSSCAWQRTRMRQGSPAGSAPLRESS